MSKERRTPRSSLIRAMTEAKATQDEVTEPTNPTATLVTEPDNRATSEVTEPSNPTTTRHGLPRAGCSKITWVLPDDLLKALRHLAVDERRQLSSYAEEALREYLRTRGTTL